MAHPGTRTAEVIVVGAGIVGAAVAYESARAGADVILVDKALPASGATGSSFGWIGGPRSWDAPDGSTPLRRGALAAYRRLEAEVPGVRVRWRGSLRSDGEGPEARGALGGGERLLDAAAVAQLEPHLRDVPHRVLHIGDDGAVEPAELTHVLVRAAGRHGARLITSTAVTSVRMRDDRVVGVETTSGFVAARTVVLTAGVDAPVLCAPLGFRLPVAPSPALLMRFTAPPGLVRTLVATGELEVRQTADGRLLVAAGYHGEVGPEDLRRAGQAMLERLLGAFDDAHGMRLVDVRLGARPMPADGLPVVGPVPGASGAYVAVMHSGVTLAPVVGRLVATELVDGVDARELHGVRPARFSAHGLDTRPASGPASMR